MIFEWIAILDNLHIWARHSSEFKTVVTFHDDVTKWKHFPRYWPFVPGIYRSPVNSPHKGQWRGTLVLSLICAWTNRWVNNRDASDLKLHRAHYDVKELQMRKVHMVVVWMVKMGFNQFREISLKIAEMLFCWHFTQLIVQNDFPAAPFEQLISHMSRSGH